jgi:hypothetical protein
MSALPSMTNRMARVEPSSEVRSPENPLSIPVRTTDSETPLAALDLNTAISLALSRTGISHKQACAYMDLDPSLWARQLQNKDNAHISLQRLSRLPAAFWVEFIAILSGPLQIVVSRADYVDLMMLRVVGLVQEISAVALQARAQRRIA